MIDSKQKQQSPQKCPKCSNTENLTVAVTCVPDAESMGPPGRLRQRQRDDVRGLRFYREACGFRAEGFVQPGERGGVGKDSARRGSIPSAPLPPTVGRRPHCG
jgi:hypothetical protein